MTLRTFCYLAILFVLLTACGQGGGEYELARTTDPLVERQVAEQRQQIESEVPGQVLDRLEWERDGQRLFSVLSASTHPMDPEAGLYLHHYRIGVGGIRPLWQFIDTVDCQEGRLHLSNLLPELVLTEVPGTASAPYLTLGYELDCRTADSPLPPARRLLLVDTTAGTPAYRVEGFGLSQAPTTDAPPTLEWTTDRPVFSGAISNYDELELLPSDLRAVLLRQWRQLL